jgi:peptide/nickel transport system ATP-binding protein/oligopeptide transport system ATP-binding protein
MNRYPHQLSGGQRQRLCIARSLALSPKLLVCDEAVSALDVSIQAQILNLMLDLKDEHDLTYLFISHNLSVVKFISDRIAVMYFGKLVELATKEQLFEQCLHPYTCALLSAVPVPDPLLKRQRMLLRGDVPNLLDPPEGCLFCDRCPFASQRCRTEEPKLTQQKNGRQVACHFAGELPLIVDWGEKSY